jgi:hypothetical protein
MSGSIFEKEQRLKSSAMATVAERRYHDAAALRDTKENARANGVAYFAGFVIEILLKARLVEKYPAIARKRHHEVGESERKIWSLIWRQHDLEEMLFQMPELEAALKVRGERDGKDHLANLKKVCATWTIHARYSPRSMLMDEASDWLDRIGSIKELLK